MPGFNLVDFIDHTLLMWIDNPIYTMLFCGVCLILAGGFMFASKVRLVGRHATASERRALVAEREAEHRRRASQLRIIAERMTDDADDRVGML